MKNTHGVVLLLVFFGLLNTPLNLCDNAAWRLLAES